MFLVASASTSCAQKVTEAPEDWAVNPGVGLVMRANPGGPAAHDARCAISIV